MRGLIHRIIATVYPPRLIAWKIASVRRKGKQRKGKRGERKGKESEGSERNRQARIRTEGEKGKDQSGRVQI